MSRLSSQVEVSSVDSLRLLASALAGRPVRVEPAEAGVPAWTNGSVIFVNGAADFQAQLAQICLQGALLAAGSLQREVLVPLVRRPKLAERYLVIEGQRALRNLKEVMPPSISVILDAGPVSASDSPSASLEIARSQQNISKPPENFGTLFVKKILDAQAHESGAAPAGQHVPSRRQADTLTELYDDAGQADENGDESGADFSSPVGGGGGLGKWLQKLFRMVRRVNGGGAPGADAPTHWSRSGSRAQARAVQSTASAETVEEAFGKGVGILYPEWNVHQRCYRPDWCRVQEIAPVMDARQPVDRLESYGLRKPISRLGMGIGRFHRQQQGDDIDIDAVIETHVEVAAGSFPDEGVYVESRRHRRDLAVMILLDISGSVAQASVSGASVHEQQRSAGAALATVLYEVGDRVALYAFHSQGRSAVHLTPVKRFDECMDSRVMNRLHSLKPGAYSRLGTAIRHGSTVLLEQGGTPRKLLVVLSDGLAYDHGYEPEYAAADVRQALGEARRDGVGCLCLSIGADTDTDALRRVFGSAAHATIPNPALLGAVIGPLFRAVLQAADVQRRIA